MPRNKDEVSILWHFFDILKYSSSMAFNIQYKLMFLTMFNSFIAKMYLERQFYFLQNIGFVQQKLWAEHELSPVIREQIKIYPNHMWNWPLLTFTQDFRLWPCNISSFPWTAHPFWAQESVWLLGKPCQVQWDRKGSGMMNSLRWDKLKGKQRNESLQKGCYWNIFVKRQKIFGP